MKKLLIICLSFIGALYLYADDNASDGRELTSATVSTVSKKPNILRIPANVELLIIVNDNSITIRFNGDFGQGNYLVTDLASGYSASGTVIATSGSSEVVSFPVSSSSSFEFNIEFEDGFWSYLTWNAE